MKITMRDGTGAVELKHVIEDVDRHGNVRVYFRRKGPGGYKVRLHATPGTAEFMAEYQAALAGHRPGRGAAAPELATPGTLRWLIEHYYRSAEYKRLGHSTRDVRKRLLDALCADRFKSEPAHGQKPFARMEPKHVRLLRDQKAELPEAANARVKALRQVFAWAIDAGHASHNPARDVPYLRGDGEGFHTWTVEEVRRYEERHPVGTKARLALAIMLFAGVRRSDAVKLGRQMEAPGGWLRFTEVKGRRRLVKTREIPILPELRQAIGAAPSGHLTYLVTTFGKSFTSNGFGNWFRKRCDEAGLPHCSAHGLRKAGATIAADNGATEHQLMAIYGWESPKQAALYTRKANRKRLAGDAMHLVVPAESDQNENRTPGSHSAPSVGSHRKGSR